MPGSGFHLSCWWWAQRRLCIPVASNTLSQVVKKSPSSALVDAPPGGNRVHLVSWDALEEADLTWRREHCWQKAWKAERYSFPGGEWAGGDACSPQPPEPINSMLMMDAWSGTAGARASREQDCHRRSTVMLSASTWSSDNEPLSPTDPRGLPRTVRTKVELNANPPGCHGGSRDLRLVGSGRWPEPLISRSPAVIMPERMVTEPLREALAIWATMPRGRRRQNWREVNTLYR